MSHAHSRRFQAGMIDGVPLCSRGCAIKHQVTDAREGTIVCSNCGLVLINSAISDESEWRNFKDDGRGKGDPNRVGGPEKKVYESIAGGSSIGGSSEIAKQANKQVDTKQKHLRKANSAILELCDDLNLPQTVKQTAFEFYEKTYTAKKFRVRGTHALVAACIYRAAQNCRVDQPHMTILNESEFPFTEKNFWQWVNFMKKKVRAIPPKPKATPQAIIKGWLSQMTLDYNPTRLRIRANKILEWITKNGALEGKRPSTIQAACVKLAAELMELTITEADLEEVSGKKMSSINAAYYVLREHTHVFQEMV